MTFAYIQPSWDAILTGPTSHRRRVADEAARVSDLAKTGANTGIISVVVVALAFNGQADDSESDKTDTQDDKSMGEAERS